MKRVLRRRRNVEETSAENPGDEVVEPKNSAAALLPAVKHADRFTFQDLVAEATADIGSRPARLVMTILGTVLGIASLVATLGFAQTAAAQIARQFDGVAATQVVVTPAKAQIGQGEHDGRDRRLPWDSPERVKLLAGVDSAALIAPVELADGETHHGRAVNDPRHRSRHPRSSSPPRRTFRRRWDGDLVTGRFFDDGHDARGEPRRGSGTARGRADGDQPRRFAALDLIAGVSYSVIGIVEGHGSPFRVRGRGHHPQGSARADFGLTAPSELTIHIALGAGPQVAKQAVLALQPDDPDSLEARSPAASSRPQPERAGRRERRVPHPGRHRSARRRSRHRQRHPALGDRSASARSGCGVRSVRPGDRSARSSWWSPSSSGSSAGIIGSALGVVAVIAVAAVQGWSPVTDPLVAVAGTLLGALVGMGVRMVPGTSCSPLEPCRRVARRVRGGRPVQSTKHEGAGERVAENVAKSRAKGAEGRRDPHGTHRPPPITGSRSPGR